MAPTPDPFRWSVEEVVEAICGASSPYTKDPSALAERVREEEIDGKTLLTFEQICSRQELMECLGIRLARYKASLSEKLVNLRANSPGYRSWYSDFKKKLSLENEGPPTPSVALLAEISGHSQVQNSAPKVNNQLSNRAVSPAAIQAPQLSGNAATKRSSENVDQEFGYYALPTSNPGADGKPVSSEPPSKRKRLQPINLTQEPLTSRTDPVPWENQPAWAYLGDGKMPMTLIESPSGLISTLVVDYNNGDFVTRIPSHIPAGRRMTVNRITKHLLRRNSRREALARSGGFRIGSPTVSDEDDGILDVADLPSEWDSDTLREIEEERRENEENEQPERFLSQDQVQTLLDQEVERMATRWRERKRGKLERKAHRIWITARRKSNRTHEIIKARTQATVYHERIQALSARILSGGWQSDEEVRLQAQCLEQSLEDKLYQLWVVETLELRTEPPRLPPTPSPQKQAKRQIDPMDEVLTSSDDDDFIVADEDETLAGGMMTDIEAAPITPINRRGLDMVDLTTTPPRTGRESRIYIDLTTPTKTNSLVPKPKSTERQTPGETEPPSIENLGSIEEICSVDKNHWSGQQDRWRLVLYMLGRLHFGRRSSILEVMKAKSSEDVWKTSVLVFLANPPREQAQLGQSEKETTDFDISWIFLCFVKCKFQSEKRMTPPSDRSRKKLQDNQKAWFAPFCDFVRESEPIFPQESQIYRTDVFDMELAEDDEDDDDASRDVSSKNRKAVAREIVQNKDAVYLRKREQERAKDHEARRLKLRAALATSGLVSQDKSRLIINESKEDDQSLLYVNQEIGKTIKDHQVDGVRFLWNQIILDPDCRQGCLLAHTMGLGKTMQVITFLVAIAEAAKSPDLSFKSQIPEDLRASQTLVLCPSGLVDNWIDELLKWAPAGSLGPLAQLDATAKGDERLSIVRNWAASGGILVVGYSMFIRLSSDEEMAGILLEKPSIIIADEAHMLKNPEGKLNRLASQFRSASRIALTGSPLANNVEEYYSMINWVAPNFLGPLAEFREVYVRDIQAGLWVDSVAYERRKALKMLQVLKDTVASKVNRATIKSCLAHDLPQKSEFVISVPPTPMQRELYTLYINGLGAVSEGQGPKGLKVRQAQIFRVVNDLALICNHPRGFHQKLLDVRQEPDKHEAFPQSIVATALRVTKGADNMEPSLSLKVQFLIMILDEARRLGDKVLVFSQSIYTLNYLESLLDLQKRKVCRLDGNTRIDQRQEKIRLFNLGEQEVYLISTTAGGVGLNIQGANRVVIFDSKWNPVNDQQAVGRAYRLGQKKKVFVYHLMVAGTFEEAMQSKAVFKTQLASRVVDKKNPIAWGKRGALHTQHIKDPPQEDLHGFIGKDRILDRLVEHMPGGSRITKIVSTDTFEEEDVNTNLTPEEHREAENLVRMNRLRRTDPAEYERMKDQQVHDQSVAQMQALHPGPHNGNAGLPVRNQRSYSFTRSTSGPPSYTPHTTSTSTLNAQVMGADTPQENESHTVPTQVHAASNVVHSQGMGTQQDNQASNGGTADTARV